jgi:Zn-dependent protease/predicted transcriptional regulator
MQRLVGMLSHGIQVGRLFGIRIALDWSLLVIFLLVVFNLAAGLFPSWHPDWSPGMMWGAALVAAVLFFLSVLVHELAHALVAKAYAIPVRRITLFLFGGVADIEEEPASPKVEALMAVVGPLVSIGLGFGFSLLGGMLAGVSAGATADPELVLQQMGPLASLLAWLGSVNVIIGLFNLIPAFPLDGGRVLHAILWGATGDLAKSTRWSSRLGQAFGWLLVVTGIAMAFGVRAPFFGTGLAGGLWLAFIGWFLSSAAAMSYRQHVVKGVLQDVPIARLMRRELPPALEANQPISALVDEIMRTGRQEFMVVADGHPIGLIRARDVRRIDRTVWDSTPLRDAATPVEKLPTVAPNEDGYTVLRRMARSDDGDLAIVVEGGAVMGIVTHDDILRWIELQTEDRSTGAGAPAFGR